ncbi:MAG: hypothetical protein ACRDH6_01565 [Actinomycetota bacterium]
MKEDVLEQIVDDYLQFRGYFTTHNVRFKPSPDDPEFEGDQDRVPSDVDVVGLHPQRTDEERVIVVTCKSWQTGFNPRRKLEELRGEAKNPKRATWRHFRELWVPKWSEAFHDTIAQLTGERTFAYRIAVTRLQGDGSSEEWARAWAEDETIKANLDGCSFGFLTLEEMWGTLLAELKKTPASSEIGRLAQLLKAAGMTASTVVAAPEPPVPGSDAAIADQLEGE